MIRSANGTKEEEGFYREAWKEVPDRPPRVVAPGRPPLPNPCHVLPFQRMRPTEKRRVV